MAFDAFETNVFRWSLRGKKTLHVVFFGDLHDDCTDSIAKEQLEDIKKKTDKLPRESVLFYGMGDYGDFMSTSERRKVSASELHESTVERFDKLAMEDMERRVKSLEFMRGRLVGLHCGNHDFRFSSGQYASEILAERMGCKHLGYTAYSRVMVSDVTHVGACSSVDVFSSHGKGSGRLIGSPFNTVAQMANIFPNSDFFVQGHDHSRGGVPATTLYADYNRKTGELDIKERTQMFMRSGSSLRGYRPKSKSYISKALYKPCALGFPIGIVEFKRVREDGADRINKTVHCLS